MCVCVYLALCGWLAKCVQRDVHVQCMCTPPQGPGNKGFDVLLQNFKVGQGASKELNEFIKER